VAGLFSGEGRFVTPDSTVIRGRPHISGFLRQLVDLAKDQTIEQRTMVPADDIAVGSERWSMRFGSGAGAARTTRRRSSAADARLAVIQPVRPRLTWLPGLRIPMTMPLFVDLQQLTVSYDELKHSQLS
jgi:hypothetical protein